MQTPSVQPQTLDQSEAAKLIGISPKHFRRLYAAGLIPPCLNLGGRLRRWHRGTIESWLANGGCPRVPEPASVVQVPV